MEILSHPERIALVSAIKSSTGSLLSLRMNTGLGVDVFIGAVQSLENKGLLVRDVNRFRVNASAIRWLAASQTTKKHQSTEEYFSTISVAQLPVGEFFIPNQELFLKDIRQIR